MIRFGHHPQFVTITCLNWLPLLDNDFKKQIIVEAIHTRVNKQQVTIYAFVIMPNHMHFIWQLHDSVVQSDFQRDLLKFTARGILMTAKMNDDPVFEKLKVIAPDRKHQVWERNSQHIELYSKKFFFQKLNYLHRNPVHPSWNLAARPEDYRYSSAGFYETGMDEFGFVTHYRG